MPVTRNEVNYVTAPLKHAMMLSEQPWSDISSDEEGVCEVIAATSDREVMIDRCASVMLSRIVALVISRGNATATPAVINVPSRSCTSNMNDTAADDSSDTSSDVKKLDRLKFYKPIVRASSRFKLLNLKKGVWKSTNISGKFNETAVGSTEYEMIISKYETECKERSKFPPSITAAVRMQVRQYVARIASWYQDVPYHTFEHATHVLLSANKLLFLLMNASENTEDPLLKHAYGLKANVSYHLALIFAALVHDVDHGGVSNQTLINECDPLSILYNDQSLLEQRSLAVAFTVLMESKYEELRAVMFPQHDDFIEFRKVVIDLVLTTDIASGERMQIVKSKWKEAFGSSEIKPLPRTQNQDLGSSIEKKKIGFKCSGARNLSSLNSISEDRYENDGNGSSDSVTNKSSLKKKLSVSPDNSLSGGESESENASDSESCDEEEDFFAQVHVQNTSRVENKIIDRKSSITFPQSKIGLRNSMLLQASSKSYSILPSSTPESRTSNDTIVRRMSLPIGENNSSITRRSGYRLGIKRAMTLSGDLIEVYANSKDDKLKATVVIEWIMKAADVSSLMQSFPNFMKWSSRLYDEIYVAHRDGRGSNPADGWFDNQITFFDSYISQVAERLEATKVFGCAGSIFLGHVHENREQWIMDGSNLTHELIEGAKNRTKSFLSIQKRVYLDQLSNHSSVN